MAGDWGGDGAFEAIPGATTRAHSWPTLPLAAETPPRHTQVPFSQRFMLSQRRPAAPNGGPPILPFGRENFHSDGRLRKQRLGPAWCHEATNSELINQPITGRVDLLAAAAGSVAPGGALKDALCLIFHTFCNVFTQLDYFIGAIEPRCDK